MNEPLGNAETREAIIQALDEFLDWTGPPWNLAADEAERDYTVLAEHIMLAIQQHGFDGTTDG